MPDPADLRARVFFALWPDAACRARCARQAARLHALCGGRVTRPESIHLTLAFVGDIARDALPRLVQAGAATRGAAFVLEFERAAFWRHNRIAYLKPATPPGALLDLVTNLEAALDAAGIAFDRRAFTPHLTLVRNAACGESRDTAIEPAIPWRADEFLLVESRRAPTGAGYAALARFKLS